MKAEKKEEEYDMGVLRWKDKVRIDIDEKIRIKVADFGNGCYIWKHFTEGI